MLPGLNTFVCGGSLAIPSGLRAVCYNLCTVMASSSASPLINSSAPTDVLTGMILPVPFRPGTIAVSSWGVSPTSTSGMGPSCSLFGSR